MTEPISIAFIGLGVMGGPMAGHLARAGYRVTAYNRSVERAAHWQAKWNAEGLAIAFADTPAKAAEGADIAFTCVGNDEDLLSVLDGEHGVLALLPQSALLVDHTTTSANIARKVGERCANLDIGFVDAPVSGDRPVPKTGSWQSCAGEPKTRLNAHAR